MNGTSFLFRHNYRFCITTVKPTVDTSSLSPASVWGLNYLTTKTAEKTNKQQLAARNRSNLLVFESDDTIVTGGGRRARPIGQTNHGYNRQ